MKEVRSYAKYLLKNRQESLIEAINKEREEGLVLDGGIYSAGTQLFTGGSVLINKTINPEIPLNAQ